MLELRTRVFKYSQKIFEKRSKLGSISLTGLIENGMASKDLSNLSVKVCCNLDKNEKQLLLTILTKLYLRTYSVFWSMN